MNITHKAYNSLAPYKADAALRSQQLQPADQGLYVYRQISVLIYPDGLEVKLESVGAASYRDGWSDVKPLDSTAFKLDWDAGDDGQMTQRLERESADVRNRVLKMVTTFRANRDRFKPVFDINHFEL